MSLWAARGAKGEEGTREREHKRTGLFPVGFDFYTNSAPLTIRGGGGGSGYLHNVDACIITGFIKRRSQLSFFTKGSKVAINATRVLIGCDEVTRNKIS